jgi:glyoxylase-like metal-dependent hydrolase (beta-lactamase superfamily II)
MIFQKFPSGPLDTNAILFGCSETKKVVVIDPAYQSCEEILREVEAHGLKVEMILLTHSHWDHIADVHELKAKTGAPVYVHPLDAGNLERPGSDGIPLFFPIHGEKPDGFLEEGRSILIGNVRIEVIHCPGHSPGGVSFYVPEHKILFSGDTLFKGSIGTLRLPTADPLRMWSSLKKLEALPADTHVVPGHGADTMLGKETWLSRAEIIFS